MVVHHIIIILAALSLPLLRGAALLRARTIFQNNRFCTRISNFLQSPLFSIASKISLARFELKVLSLKMIDFQIRSISTPSSLSTHYQFSKTLLWTCRTSAVSKSCLLIQLLTSKQQLDAPRHVLQHQNSNLRFPTWNCLAAELSKEIVTAFNSWKFPSATFRDCMRSGTECIVAVHVNETKRKKKKSAFLGIPIFPGLQCVGAIHVSFEQSKYTPSLALPICAILHNWPALYFGPILQIEHGISVLLTVLLHGWWSQWYCAEGARSHCAEGARSHWAPPCIARETLVAINIYLYITHRLKYLWIIILMYSDHMSDCNSRMCVCVYLKQAVRATLSWWLHVKAYFGFHSWAGFNLQMTDRIAYFERHVASDVIFSHALVHDIKQKLERVFRHEDAHVIGLCVSTFRHCKMHVSSRITYKSNRLHRNSWNISLKRFYFETRSPWPFFRSSLALRVGVRFL